MDTVQRVNGGIAARRVDHNGVRRFHPAHYHDIFGDFNVKAVVRLNEQRYRQ